MKKIILLLGVMGMLLGAGTAQAEWCYQETANVSTDCGGLSTGTYTPATSTWTSGSQPVDKIYDGNWSPGSYSYPKNPDSVANILINETKPANSNAAIWSVEYSYTAHQLPETAGCAKNMTIPSDCWNAYSNIIALKVEALWSSVSGYSWAAFSCYNGSWRVLMNATDEYGGNLTSVSCPSGSYGLTMPQYIYEKAMFWNITYPLLSNCTWPYNATGYYAKTLNFTLLRESNLSTVTGNLDLSITKDSSSYSWAFNGSFNYPICIYPKSANYTIDAIGQYYSDPLIKRNYYISGGNISNASQNINLYVMDVNTTLVNMKVQDAYGNVMEGVIITAQKYYPGTGNYIAVSTSQTDFNGNAIAYLDISTTMYKFILTQGGSVIYQTSPMIITTEMASNGVTFTINLNNYGEAYRYMNNVGYSCYFNNVTSILSCTAIDTSGLMVSACMQVKKWGVLNLTQVYYDCMYSSGGTLVYDLGNYTGNRYVYSFWMNFPESQYLIYQETLDFGTSAFYEANPGEAIMIMIILVVFCSLAGFFSPNPVIPLAMSIVSVILGFLLGIMPIGWGGIVGLICVGGILAIKMRL